MNLRILFLLLAVFLPAGARSQSQAEMNADAAAEFAKADKELNEVYAKVRGALTKERVKMLREYLLEEKGQ